MNYNVYFSPTGSTQRVTTFISEQFEQHKDIDISVLQSDYHLEFKTNDLCVIGVPSFGGRVAKIARERLKMMKGHQTPAIIVVTYGNRAYEDTLLELKNIVTDNGFICIGAMGIVCEHSIIHEFGKGRPNDKDLQEIVEYVKKLKERLTRPIENIQVSGNMPYREYSVAHVIPITTKKCTECGICAKLCPIGAISMITPNQTNRDICISCMRCVKVCPQHARKCESSMIAVLTKKLKNVCEIAKKNDFF
ncbi:EFR1 family ferrodoxin [Candidatus Stoquefichus massiliensis]|uniref:EFR1 family ferrodoxin n=1 Tax=Candidatus Stoquefichus massiliensis TaxID=1470350 RepID=UPI0004888F67|nr:EFR1 family ferrodoxin [Candidatus Stoquefichus massiliensis]